MVLHTQVSYPLGMSLGILWSFLLTRVAHVNTATHWLELRPGKVYWNLAEQGWAKAAWQDEFLAHSSPGR